MLQKKRNNTTAYRMNIPQLWVNPALYSTHSLVVPIWEEFEATTLLCFFVVLTRRTTSLETWSRTIVLNVESWKKENWMRPEENGSCNIWLGMSPNPGISTGLWYKRVEHWYKMRNEKENIERKKTVGTHKKSEHHSHHWFLDSVYMMFLKIAVIGESDTEDIKK